jgi:hypothetical protein
MTPLEIYLGMDNNIRLRQHTIERRIATKCDYNSCVGQISNGV